ncbi:MAG: hypothetical protein JSS82_19295 [Bacteroidetes bacterium]|nr:hypothetical protein [Bacteroidota bacterium]
MKAVKLYDYYSFGFNYQLLLYGSASKTVEEFVNDFRVYFDFIKEHNLKVTISSLKLQHINEDLEILGKLNKGKKKKEKIPTELHTKIINKITKADSTLDAELNTEISFLLDKKRFSNEILIDDIESVFSKFVFSELPEIAKYDFKECGKCLAFDRFTAAGFHALRGTEDTLKFFYSKLLNTAATEIQTWGSFYSEIFKQNKAGIINPLVSEELLVNLDNLRKYYRNKTQHPQLIYSLDEVQDLFFLCIKTVNQMMNDLEERKLISYLPF